MRTGVTLGFPHGGGQVKTLALPSVDLEVQKAKFKEWRDLRAHPEFERVEVWSNRQGVILKAKFEPVKAEPTKTEQPKLGPVKK